MLNNRKYQKHSYHLYFQPEIQEENAESEVHFELKREISENDKEINLNSLYYYYEYKNYVGECRISYDSLLSYAIHVLENDVLTKVDIIKIYYHIYIIII